MRTLLLILALSTLVACGDEPAVQPFVMVTKCPESAVAPMEKHIGLCMISRTQSQFCAQQAKDMFCEKVFIANPNYNADIKED